MKCLLVCALGLCTTGCLTPKLWTPDYPGRTEPLEVLCDIRGAVCRQHEEEQACTVALRIAINEEWARKYNEPILLGKALEEGEGWAVIRVSWTIAELEETLLNPRQPQGTDPWKLELLREDPIEDQPEPLWAVFSQQVHDEDGADWYRTVGGPCSVVPGLVRTPQDKSVLASLPVRSLTCEDTCVIPGSYTTLGAVGRGLATPVVVVVDFVIVLPLMLISNPIVW